MKKAVFLFEHLGYAAEPFTRAGWHTIAVDMLNKQSNPRVSQSLDWNILHSEDELVDLCRGAEFVFGFPPCTDLAVSGARHFYSKRKVNPNFQQAALRLVMTVPYIADFAGVPWCFENLKGAISTMWRKPDLIIDPYDFGGYLPPDDQHPDWPQYIAPRDAYPKETCLWKSKDFAIPPKRPVRPEPGWSKQTTQLGGKSLRTKIIRSASPRGFFTALAHLHGAA